MNKDTNKTGYTTGACAAAAAKAAAVMLLSGDVIGPVSIETPKGLTLTLDISDIEINPGFISAAVQKDSGDDPDITNGVLIYAKVKRTPNGITIIGGEGVGRVTKKGLDQPVGEYAINSIPREMIKDALERAAKEYDYKGGFEVIISVPGGCELALKTFNPRLGIEGGISIIGTTGIVEPMSVPAIIETTKLELRQLKAAGANKVILTPGNYGEAYAKDVLKLDMSYHINCSNYIGEAIDNAVSLSFKEILLVGHIGKMVKLGIGMLNTHNSAGDGRLECLAACALYAGGGIRLLKGILSCATTDAATYLIDSAGMLEKTMEILGARIQDTLNRRVPPGVSVGFVCFTNTRLGLLTRGGRIDGWKMC